jgi:hypothetical protein
VIRGSFIEWPQERQKVIKSFFVSLRVFLWLIFQQGEIQNHNLHNWSVGFSILSSVLWELCDSHFICNGLLYLRHTVWRANGATLFFFPLRLGALAWLTLSQTGTVWPTKTKIPLAKSDLPELTFRVRWDFGGAFHAPYKSLFRSWNAEGVGCTQCTMI